MAFGFLAVQIDGVGPQVLRPSSRSMSFDEMWPGRTFSPATRRRPFRERGFVPSLLGSASNSLRSAFRARPWPIEGNGADQEREARAEMVSKRCHGIFFYLYSDVPDKASIRLISLIGAKKSKVYQRRDCFAGSAARVNASVAQAVPAVEMN